MGSATAGKSNSIWLTFLSEMVTSVPWGDQGGGGNATVGIPVGALMPSMPLHATPAVLPQKPLAPAVPLPEVV